jgi:hypothetical protein
MKQIKMKDVQTSQHCTKIKSLGSKLREKLTRQAGKNTISSTGCQIQISAWEDSDSVS